MCVYILSIICKIKCLVNVVAAATAAATVYLYSMHAYNYNAYYTSILTIMFDSFAHSIF